MVFVSGLWIVTKLDFRDKWSVCNLDSVSNCLQQTQRSKKGKNSTKLCLWGLIIYFFDYRSSASSTTSPSCFFPIFWRVPGHYATIIHTILCIILWVVSRKCIFAAVISSEGIFFTICCLCSFFIRKKYQLYIIETILDTYFILNNSASFPWTDMYTKEKNLITH